MAIERNRHRKDGTPTGRPGKRKSHLASRNGYRLIEQVLSHLHNKFHLQILQRVWKQNMLFLETQLVVLVGLMVFNYHRVIEEWLWLVVHLG